MPGFNIKTSSDCIADNDCGDGYTGPKVNVETARKHRYQLRILRPVKDVLLYAFKCQRPVCEADRIVMHHGQDEIYKPGKTRWLPIEVTFYEIVKDVNTTAQMLNRWWGKNMLSVNSSTLFQDSYYKERCELELTDGCGKPVWAYYLYQVWPSKVSPSELSYTDTDLSEISCTLEISKAEEKPV